MFFKVSKIKLIISKILFLKKCENLKSIQKTYKINLSVRKYKIQIKRYKISNKQILTVTYYQSVNYYMITLS